MMGRRGQHGGCGAGRGMNYMRIGKGSGCLLGGLFWQQLQEE
jgi:hypothetical protein